MRRACGVFQCLDYHDDTTFPELQEVLGCFNEGVKQYRRQEWDRASDFFAKVLKANPDDMLSQTYIDRCELMRANPPSEEWDGVRVMTAK